MYKLYAIVAIAALLIISCNKDASKTPEQTAEIKVLKLEDLAKDDFEYKSGDVTVEGLCVHVCAHSGKKMFIVGKDENNKLQIFTSEKIATFDKNLEGNNIQVTGTLEEERIDNKYIANMEAELAKENPESKGTCPTEEDMNKINDLKSKVANSKKGYISIYTMIGSKVKSI